MALCDERVRLHGLDLSTKHVADDSREPEIEKPRISEAINSLPLPGVATLMPLRCCRVIAADNRCASGIHAALPELILFYEPLPITTQARHYATRGSIMTAALPDGCGLSVLPVHFLTLQKRKNPTGLTAGLEYFIAGRND